EVDLACRDFLLQRRRQRVRINLQADGERGLWRNPRTNPAVLLTGNGLVQLERVAPEGLAPEGVVAERLAALVQHRAGIARDLSIEVFLGRSCTRSNHDPEQSCSTQCRNGQR